MTLQSIWNSSGWNVYDSGWCCCPKTDTALFTVIWRLHINLTVLLYVRCCKNAKLVSPSSLWWHNLQRVSSLSEYIEYCCCNVRWCETSFYQLISWRSMVNVPIRKNNRSPLQMIFKVMSEYSNSSHDKNQWHNSLGKITEMSTFSLPSRRPSRARKWATWDPKPPIDPSSTVIKTSCDFARLRIRALSNGLQNLASATVRWIPWRSTKEAAAKQLWTAVP